MQISKINNVCLDNEYNLKSQNKTNRFSQLSNTFNLDTTSFKAVSKGMQRFHKVNERRFPTTVGKFLDTIQNLFSITPQNAQKTAYAKLNDKDSNGKYIIKTVDDIQKNFPDENVFYI